MLSIYISAHCIGCTTARWLADQVRSERPDVPLVVIDIDDPAVEVPAKVIGTPFYTWGDRVLFMGNPNAAELLQRVGALHDGEGQSAAR